MEEVITRAVKEIIETHFPVYLAKFAERVPVMTLADFYSIQVGQPRKIDGYPAITIVSSGWSKSSEDLIYSENQDIIDLYRFILTIYLEGDDEELLEYMGIRYREAIKECFKNHYLLNGTARGCIISGGDNFNNAIGEQSVELSFRMNFDVYGMDQDSTIKIKE